MTKKIPMYLVFLAEIDREDKSPNKFIKFNSHKIMFLNAIHAREEYALHIVNSLKYEEKKRLK
jgi:hypothetical protein